ncbi:MAG: nucleotide exchange factor GrpE [Rhodospirillaceae bacterium]|nr:nucleotide exchange factor GrpE [Rhodospirillaceae bacterium]MBT4490103.1 nucleotide exchange factor GrpE [Rhodospirillaceae bacterium]MBT5192026.1 nucleotide exchange factor GrpE [Rhodospirillaceae bacterium]MBT5895730.1 nucleotide exchange factor GrpE [Rhodospirillaceae bacterium]MBT6428145.1 nucleotide exchange factor GrpE [Rhodospirillaceae bacterium]
MNEAENFKNSEKPHPEASEGPESAPESAPKSAPEAVVQPVELTPDELGTRELGTHELGVEDAPDEPGELELAYGEVADLKDKLLRAMAETENMRRRAERDKTDTRKYAVADFARDMLAVSDNLQRALSAVSEEARGGNPELAQLLEGVELTRKELQGHFDKHGIKEINPLGEKLDPNFHQAVVQIEDPEAAQGTVVQVMQSGYVIHDRLLRAAMVGVAKGAPAGKPEAATEPTDETDNGQNVDTQA